MLNDREIDLAWALADIVGEKVPMSERHSLYITLGLGEIGTAIHLLLGYAVEHRIPLTVGLFLEARSWSQSYRGSADQLGLAGLLDRATVV